jgi:hypothetical protein
MTQRMTSINLPGRFGAGYADYGRKTVAEMIALIRDHAELQKRDAEAILAAKDSDFYVCTYRGIHVRRDRVVLQSPKKRG